MCSFYPSNRQVSRHILQLVERLETHFEEQAAKFIKAQELIYEDPKNAKEHFNNGIDACIQCHEVKCGGPIPKIKKLYIE